MREILFKAKRLDNGECVDGFYCCIGPVGQEKHYIIPMYASAFYGIEVDPFTVCEWTGLIDRDGTKVFEGDVISIENPKPFAPWICKVGYESCCWYLDGKSRVAKVMLADYADTEMEIIGNIHDGEGGQHGEG